jgi:hypothetical protein
MAPIGCGLAFAASLAIAGGDLGPAALFDPARADDPPVSGLVLPPTHSRRGRTLFATKGCFVCHAINGGGGDAAPLDASTMDPAIFPFEFFARMWLGTKPMIAMQEERTGGQLELSAGALDLGDRFCRPRRGLPPCG